MARLVLSLLGTFQATLDEQPIHRFRVNTARALLAYLAVEADRPHHRDTLAGLLWPNVANAVAINNLRHALSDLRKAIGDTAAAPFLHITRHTLQFNSASDSWLDTQAFRNGVQSDDPVQQAQAVGLYRGPFLDGFSLNTSPAFEEWLIVRQQQYHQLAVIALRQLADWHIQRGEYPVAQRYIQRMLELEPWHEEALGLLMELLARDGRRTEALAQYDAYCRLIDRELGVPPAPELTARYDRLRADQPVSDWTSIPGYVPLRPRSTSATFPIRPTFVARDTELARLAASLDRACTGSGQIVLITGEAGSGKTALINEFIRQALHAHGDVLAAGGMCSAHTGPGEPYLPVREIVQLLTGDIEAKRASGAISPEHARRLWDNLPDALKALIEHGADLIGSLVTAETLALRAEVFTSATSPWRTRLIELAQRPRPPASPDLQQPLMAMLRALSQTRTLILVLDDLHWADEATLNWLSYLGRQLDQTRCLIIGAYRTADVALGRADQRHPLAAVSNELQRHLGDIRIDLDRVPGRAFIDALLDAEPNTLSTEFRDTLYQHTGGQALFTVELINGLKSRGQLVRDEHQRWAAGATLDWQHLPARVEAVINERLERVPDQWQALLDAACVEGDEFTAEVIAEALGLEATDVTRILSGELNRRYQLIVPTRLERQGAQRLTYFRFRHNLFERYLYQRLDVVTRTRLHEAIGLALEHYHLDRPAQLARQFEAAGLRLKAADYWRQAGQHALRLAAYPEAHSLLTHGLALLADRPASPEKARCELNLQLTLGKALLSQGWGTVDRARVFDRAFELAQQTGAALDFLHALYALAELAQGQGDIVRSLTFGQELLRLAEQADEPLLIVEALFVIGSGYAITGQFAAAVQQLERALVLTETTAPETLIGLGSMDLRASSLAWLSLVCWMTGQVDRAEGYFRQAMERLRQIDHPLTLGFVLTASTCPRMLLRGDLIAVQQHIELLHRVAETYLPMFRPWDAVFTGYMRVCQGEAAGITQLRQGIAQWEASGTRGGYVHQRLLLSDACLRTGEIETGLQIVAETLALIESSGMRMYEAEVRRMQGELWQAHGDDAQAQACFQTALAIARSQAARMWEQRAASSLERSRARYTNRSKR